MIRRLSQWRWTAAPALLIGVLLCATLGCGSQDETPPPDTEPPTEDFELAPQEPAQPDTPDESKASSTPEELPEVVARVGDISITREEYRAEATELRERLYMQRTGRAPVPHVTPLPELTEEHKASIVNAMIEARIFGQLAQESGVEVTEDEIDAQIAEIKGELVTESAFQSLLQHAKLSDEQFRENVRLRLLMEKYGDSLVTETEFTDGQLEQVYTRLKEQGAARQPQTADIAHIFLAVTSGEGEPSEAEVLEQMEAIRARIVGGEDFEAVAKEVSQDSVSAPRGGLYEKVRKGQLGQGFDDRLFTMPLNEVSEPFRSLKGWHIMKVLARHEPRELTMEEAQPVIEKMLHTARRNEAMAQKVAQVRPTMDIELFMNIDLRQANQKQIIPVPADAVKNPNVLPESLRPLVETTPSDPAPSPDSEESGAE